MTRCNCCMNPVESDMASCPVCGFPSLGVVDPRVVQEYRHKRLQGIALSVKIYCYEPDSVGNLTEQKSEYLPIGSAESLQHGTVKWLGNEFEPFDIEHDISLDLCITVGADAKTFSLSVPVRQHLTCSKLGLYMDDGFRIRFAVGSEQQYVYSESVSLLKIQTVQQEVSSI